MIWRLCDPPPHPYVKPPYNLDTGLLKAGLHHFTNNNDDLFSQKLPKHAFPLHFSIAAHSIDFCSGAFPISPMHRTLFPFCSGAWRKSCALIVHSSERLSIVSLSSVTSINEHQSQQPSENATFWWVWEGSIGVWWGTSAQGSRNTCPNTWHSPSMPSSSSSPSSYSSHSYSSQLPPLLLLLLLFPLTKHHLSVSPVWWRITSLPTVEILSGSFKGTANLALNLLYF